MDFIVFFKCFLIMFGHLLSPTFVRLVIQLVTLARAIDIYVYVFWDFAMILVTKFLQALKKLLLCVILVRVYMLIWIIFIQFRINLVLDIYENLCIFIYFSCIFFIVLKKDNLSYVMRFSYFQNYLLRNLYSINWSFFIAMVILLCTIIQSLKNFMYMYFM